jgi:EmrB/QacA subfamily drug resistance transporter
MTTSQTGLDDGGRWSSRTWALLAVLCAALFLDSMDVSMVGVALPSIRADLGISTSDLQWIVSAYVLGYGGFLLLGGRAADLLGRRQVFLASLVLFTLASVMGGVVSTAALLIISRFIKGLAAAFTAPAGMSIIATTFPEGAARNRALGIYTGCAAAGFTLGLVLSGLLTEVSWRATFLFPAPLALVALAGAVALVPRAARSGRPGQGYDLAGAVAATASVLLLVFTVTEAQSAGWTSLRTIASFFVTAVLIAAFIVIEQRTPSPLVRLGILRSRTVAGGNIAGFLFQGSYMGFQFVLTLYLQRLLGWSALTTAFAILPMGALVGILAPRMGAVIGRFGPPAVIVTGFCMLVAGYANMLRIGPHGDYPSVVLPSLLLIGLSFVTIFPCVNIQATSHVRDAEQGMAAGLVNASIQIGAAIGLAAVTAVVTASTGAGSTGAASAAASQLAGYRAGLAASLGVGALGLVIVVVAAIIGRRARIPAPDETSAFALASLTEDGLAGSAPPDPAASAASLPLTGEMER